MTNEFRVVLLLFANAALGRQEMDDLSDADIAQIINISKKQGIFNFVYSQISRLDNEQVHKNRNIYLSSVSENVKRLIYVDKLLSKLEAQGVNYCVLKGETISDIYACPELRISGDVDIYVGASKEKATCKFFSDHGFVCHDRIKTSNHTICYSEKYGLVEVHNSLFNELYRDIWFKKGFELKEPYRKVISVSGLPVNSLGISDGFIFLTLHTIKHFLCEGLGIRQVMDYLLYSVKHCGTIDWKRFWNLADMLNYTQLVMHFYGIGVEYFGFNPNDYGCNKKIVYDKAVVDDIINHCEETGIFGKASTGLENFHITLTREAYSDEYKVDEYFDKTARKNSFGMIFKNLTKYSYYRRYKWLFPVAVCHRIFSFVFDLIMGKKNIGGYIKKKKVLPNEKENKKIELLKKINLINRGEEQ